jgi:hypothetical protein
MVTFVNFAMYPVLGALLYWSGVDATEHLGKFLSIIGCVEMMEKML